MAKESQTELTAKVQALLVEVLQVEPGDVTIELAFGDLPQWDSMGHMDVMMVLEEHFGVEITAETITELVSVPAICTYLLEIESG
jgi:acyl carrier protein